MRGASHIYPTNPNSPLSGFPLGVSTVEPSEQEAPISWAISFESHPKLLCRTESVPFHTLTEIGSGCYEFSGGIFQSSSNGNFLLTGLERARWEWQSWVRYPGFPAAGTFSPSWDPSPSLPIPGRRQGERIPSHPARHHKATDGHRVKRSMRDR